ncbi:MAG: sulfite exporter TauE/SafE family protein [Candidatus Omnitrophota bacterium]|jgi:sulfite exporter TauE/SafE
MIKTIITLFLLGLSFGFGPCLASCGPILIAYLAGTKKNVRKSITGYLLFSLSRISAYLILGLLVFFLGRLAASRLLGEYSRYIFILGGGFIAAIGALMMSGRRIEVRAWNNLPLLGLIIGLLPCAPLLAIFSYLGLISRAWWQSLLYSFSFGLGTLLSPLLLLAGFTGLIPRFLQNKKDNYDKIFIFICGLIIVFLGLQLMRRGF